MARHLAPNFPKAGLLAAALVGALLPGVALAIADPDSLTIDNVRAYSGVLETDDLLVLVKYDLVYGSTPAELVSDAYLGRFIRGTTELNSVEPFAFNDRGYGVGVFSFYWTAAQVTTDSIEFNDSNAQNYAISLHGKVGVFPGSPPSTTTNTITWRDATDTKNQLLQDVIELARQLEGDADWVANSQDLISTSFAVIRLTAAGEEYFATAITRLANMIPELFESAGSPAAVIERDHERTFSNSRLNFWENNWVDTRFENLASQFRMPKIMLTTIFAFSMMLMIAFYAAKAFEGSDRGIEFGILTMALTLPLFIDTGFISLVVGAIAGLFAVLGLGWAFWGRRSGG